ncbi:hypothetical protein ACFLS9_10510 [Bacteroidota bacterium]
MSLLTVFTLVIVTAVVWGGFIFFLTKAIKKERKKSQNEER